LKPESRKETLDIPVVIVQGLMKSSDDLLKGDEKTKKKP
jgi:hypothetical protein